MVMAEILIPTRATRVSSLFADTAVQLQHANNVNRNIVADIMPAYKPYLLSVGINDTRFHQQMCTIPEEELTVIAETAQHYGDMTVPIAELVENEIIPFLHNYQDFGLPASSAVIGAMSEQATGLHKALAKYQAALVDLHNTSKTQQQQSGARAKSAYNPVIKQKVARVKLAHAELNGMFKHQLERYAAIHKSSKVQSVLSDVNNWINIARDGKDMRGSSRGSLRTAQSLTISSSKQVSTLSNYAKHARLGGSALIVVDAGLRVNKVRSARAKGQDANRVAVTEGAGFVASTTAGILTAKLTVGLGIALSVTPLGLFVLIGVGLTTGYIASTTMDSAAKQLAGNGYDLITGNR
jgi:hypothetical protein